MKNNIFMELLPETTRLIIEIITSPEYEPLTEFSLRMEVYKKMLLKNNLKLNWIKIKKRILEREMRSIAYASHRFPSNKKFRKELDFLEKKEIICKVIIEKPKGIGYSVCKNFFKKYVVAIKNAD